MSELRELYQEVILDHNKRPRNFRTLPEADHMAEGHNPLCGDNVTVYLQMDGDVIRDISFQGSGCAISKASASLMTTELKGKTQAEAEVIFQRFHDLVTGGMDDVQEDDETLGKLAVFSGVREYPARVKCASLAWHTLHSALDEGGRTVTTEEGDEAASGA
ncbi:MAG: SUF system NifU family Fe-S cluster assembly protein [Armatimonadetes bacterium]|nr:SUF system NifU family Fe-S cluster assembly protein [Armatimonadota bacterium]